MAFIVQAEEEGGRVECGGCYVLSALKRQRRN